MEVCKFKVTVCMSESKQRSKPIKEHKTFILEQVIYQQFGVWTQDLKNPMNVEIPILVSFTLRQCSFSILKEIDLLKEYVF